MKLAILDAVPEKYWACDEGITDASKFADMLAAAGFPGQVTIFYTAEGEWPDSVAGFDAYLVTGSPCGVHDPLPWIAELSRLVGEIANRQLPMVGVCFGHQLIAHVFGGRVQRRPGGWLLGLPPFELLELPNWMGAEKGASLIYHINQDEVVELPPGARCIGRSTRCRHSAYLIGDHILCMQGHPEQPARAMRNFINELRDELSDEQYSEAMRQIGDSAPHAGTWGRWISEFYTRQLGSKGHQ